MQRRFYNRRAIRTVAKVLPPSGYERYSAVHKSISKDEMPINTVLLLLALAQLTKDRDDMPLPAVLERVSPYLDGPQQIQVNSLVNLSKMSSSLSTMKKSGNRGTLRDPMKNVQLIKALSDVANPPSQPVLKNIGNIYERGQTMSRSLKQMQSLRSNKGGAQIGNMMDVMSNIMPSGSPLSSMGGVIKAAQMMGNMGNMGMPNNKGNAQNKGNNNFFDDDDDDDDKENDDE